jgi:release factor glutamine methyltransferase
VSDVNDVSGGLADGVATWRQLRDDTAARLQRVDVVDDARQEARWLVERASGFDAPELVLALDEPATTRGATHLHQMIERRVAGEPLQYVLGRWGFRTLDLYVDRRVLIPRPETEVLAGMAVAEADRLGARVAVDLGTGSGALALALAVERPKLEVWGTDLSAEALAVARANCAGQGRAAARVRLVEGSWFRALPDDLRGRIDVVVANPPYVAMHEVPDLPAEVRAWEPEVALVATGPTGLDDVAAIVDAAPGWLARPGSLLVEMAPHQTDEATQLARQAGFTSVTVWPDLTGRDRILQARL